MRLLVVLVMGAVLVVGGSRQSMAACNDAAAVATTRAAADATCESKGSGCTSAVNHGQYVRCVAEQVNLAVENKTLPKECKGAVKSCAAKSTCGKPGFVTCCRTKVKSDGTPVTKCSIKRDAAHCLPPKGGTACAGTQASCCDPCSSASCGSPSGAFVDHATR